MTLGMTGRTVRSHFYLEVQAIEKGDVSLEVRGDCKTLGL